MILVLSFHTIRTGDRNLHREKVLTWADNSMMSFPHSSVIRGEDDFRTRDLPRKVYALGKVSQGLWISRKKVFRKTTISETYHNFLKDNGTHSYACHARTHKPLHVHARTTHRFDCGDDISFETFQDEWRLQCWHVNKDVPEQCLHIKDEQWRLAIQEYRRLSPMWHRSWYNVSGVDKGDLDFGCEYCFKNHVLSLHDRDGGDDNDSRVTGAYVHRRVQVGPQGMVDVLLCDSGMVYLQIRQLRLNALTGLVIRVGK